MCGRMGYPCPAVSYTSDSGIFCRNNALNAMKEASRISRENGIADMTLDGINTQTAEFGKVYFFKLAPISFSFDKNYTFL